MVGGNDVMGATGSDDIGSDVTKDRKSRGLEWETADRWEKGIAGSDQRRNAMLKK